MSHTFTATHRPAAPFERLPPELIDLVVGHVADQPRPLAKLASLLYVSRAFANPAKRRCFRSIKITYYHWYPNQPKCALLHDVLKGDPSVLDHTRQVSITFDSAYRDDDVQQVFSINNDDFISIIHLISKCRITDLSLRGIHPKGRSYVALYGGRTLAALFALRCNPHLRKLSLHDLGLIPGFLATGIPSKDRVGELWMRETDFDLDAVWCRHCDDKRTYPYLGGRLDPDSEEAVTDSADTSTAIPGKANPRCLMLNPLVQDYCNEKDIRPFSRLKFLHVDHEILEDGFPWRSCFPLQPEGPTTKGRLTYRGVTTGYAVPTFPDLSDFEFSSLEKLSLGSPYLDTGHEHYYADEARWPRDYKILFEIIRHAGPCFTTLTLNDRFQVGSHTRPNFGLNGIFKLGKIRTFHIDSFWERLIEYNRDEAEQVHSIASFLERNAPLNGLNTLALDLAWRGGHVDEIATRFVVGSPTDPWMLVCDALKKSGLRKVRIDVWVKWDYRLRFGLGSFAEEEDRLREICSPWKDAIEEGVGQDIEMECVVFYRNWTEPSCLSHEWHDNAPWRRVCWE